MAPMRNVNHCFNCFHACHDYITLISTFPLDKFSLEPQWTLWHYILHNKTHFHHIVQVQGAWKCGAPKW